MEASKREWIPVGVPKALFQQIKELLGYTGDPSVAEYVRFAIRERLKYDTEKYEEELTKAGMIGLQEEAEQEIRERLE